MVAVIGTVLHWSDILVLLLYFLLILGFGVWSSCKNRGSVGGYFLAGRSMHFIPVGASLFASNIGSGHFIGLSGSGASSGIGVAGFEIGAVYMLMILGWLFVPVYMKAEVYTMPQYLKLRFGGERIRIYLTCLALMLSIFTKISVDLYSGAVFLQQALNWNLYASVIALILLAAFFTVGGGLTAVIWTDFIQTVIMIISAVILMIISFARVGGIEKIRSLFPYAIANTTLRSTTECGIPNENYFSLIRPFDADLPWFGIILGGAIVSVWYWSCDQVIVQRTLAAKNLSHARAGCLVAGLLKFLPLFLMVFPGMVARILFPDEIGCTDPNTCYQVCHSRNGCNDIAYPLLVIRLMPNAIRGLTLACMIAALMSSLTSIFNSSSTIFTIDIWQRFRKNAHDWELMIVGRVFVMILVAVSILWIPIIRAAQGSRLFDYIQAVQSFLAPPVAACYLLGILWKRINEEGAFWGLISGLFVGMVRFIWEYSYTAMPCELEHLDKRPSIVRFNFLYFSILLFVISGIVTIVVSLLTKPIPDKYIAGLTIFDLDNLDKPVPIPTRSGSMYKANTYYDEEQPCSFENPYQDQPEAPPTDAEKKALHFFDTKYSTGISFYVKTGFAWICGLEKNDELDGQSIHSNSAANDNTSSRRSICVLREPNISSWHKYCSYGAVQLRRQQRRQQPLQQRRQQPPQQRRQLPLQQLQPPQQQHQQRLHRPAQRQQQPRRQQRLLLQPPQQQHQQRLHRPAQRQQPPRRQKRLHRLHRPAQQQHQQQRLPLLQLPVTTTIILPVQCSSYTTNVDSTRRISYMGTSTCDSTLFGTTGTWVRFMSPAGATMPTSAPSTSTCGTDAPGWFNGAYPSTAGSTTTGTVCYNWAGNTCNWSNSIQITHCSTFYVFKLINTPVCNLRYCTV
ncbi:unnamed protein product [Rotaria socialis]|uniref:UMOD/GP2/OIT3-like D8C domain-containing protein n=1 Tax=Rotaria socialis TaxID=392032 RepID=A0A818QC64_9BILA|nr:unnamed protein product [Rotaria socialis]